MLNKDCNGIDQWPNPRISSGNDDVFDMLTLHGLHFDYGCSVMESIGSLPFPIKLKIDICYIRHLTETLTKMLNYDNFNPGRWNQ